MVILEPDKAPPVHKHDDTEQVFYIMEGVVLYIPVNLLMNHINLILEMLANPLKNLAFYYSRGAGIVSSDLKY